MQCPDCKKEIGQPPCTCECGAVIVLCPACKGHGTVVSQRKGGK
jgi:hypothetical protein